jgi:uncharacterized protein (DUF433 family)
VNIKLVESLAQMIEALPVEDYKLLQQKLAADSIKKTPGVAGGYACIRNTRIAVWTIISLMNQGMDETALLLDFPGLTHSDFSAVRDYYQINRAEIDAVIAEHDREEEGDGWVLCQ